MDENQSQDGAAACCELEERKTNEQVQAQQGAVGPGPGHLQG
jgi:hypothetical protein